MANESFDFIQLATPGVQGLAPYEPGKPIDELRREYGLERVIKLASNENPLGPSPRAQEAAAAMLSEAHRYPDGNGFELKAAIAERHGVGPERVTLGNGSNDVLALVAMAFLEPGRKAMFSEHAFAVYPIVTQAAGAEAIVTPAFGPEAAQPHGHDLAAMAELIDESVAVVFVANPNNPTGTWLEELELRSFLDRVPVSTIAVVDEAYFEYAASESGYPDASKWLDDYPNLVVTRSFSKVHGLGGLRVGYALSHPQVGDLLNRVRQPFNCSAPAQAAAAASLADKEHIERSVSLNDEQRDVLARGLAELGVAALPSVGNFLTFDAGDKAAQINEGLLRSGVIVRPVDAYGLPGHIRVTVGTPAENRTFLAALAEQLKGVR
ncbi:biosynthetic Aromatic amino acid aminotransferase beta [Halorhodospira halochloris]|uniref:Histidinol-phosphate aminotransferase n=1 Tax=Halorhodospira halochloris TaxID=1052 RepID=A0A120MZQ0_HALHR|nr:histidinol-phosphate transaminase [Halorhodospira halochloris]MBK1651486.1 histidinol-phosphate transaminase [Halorhodospira halochloris]MCG5548024.1 histidinol-phosphate transaminase [Halorhodospira halochloris]BAU57251.1 biosynthetic Aromatic amino acid aminotransferase beta [Halorhodospira halochloris]